MDASMNLDKLNIQSFVSLKKLEQGSDLKNIEICSQSIYRWVQFCEYHYFTLINATTKEDLRRDLHLSIRRQGEPVKLRFVYEANTSGFLSSLHSLLDSFPYLLNLFIPVCENPNSTQIKWTQGFLNKYKEYDFFTNLIEFVQDDNFQKVKGYVNTIKHKHLIRIANKGETLEFEKFNYKLPKLVNEKFEYLEKSVENQNVIDFIVSCYDDLIPKFFILCNAVQDSKRVS